MSDQAFADAQGARYRQPDPTPFVNPFDPKKRLWSRTHPMQCPWCLNTFYGLQPEDEPFVPWSNPKGNPRYSDGQRQVCGHPLCREAEFKQAFDEKMGVVL